MTKEAKSSTFVYSDKYVKSNCKLQIKEEFVEMKTFLPKVEDIKNKEWFLVDASDKVLGRIAVDIATVLRGKHKPTYTPHLDAGDFVVVVNADKFAVTGAKMEKKNYYRHSGYMGGLTETNLEKLMKDKPEEAIKQAVKGMLPKGILGRAMVKKLKVYSGSEHPHIGQKPVPMPKLHKGAVA